MDLKSKIILISGPTASGKSKFAIKISKKINGEIINADSMQIYKEINILNAKPEKKNYNLVKHHLYGIHSVKKNFSSGQWLNLVKTKISEIRKKNKIPVIVGGTGLYFKILTDGLVKIPRIPKKFRVGLTKIHNKIGQKKFYKELIKIDKLAKVKINKNDVQRTIRAYEVKKFTGKSMFDWYKDTKSKFDKNSFIKILIDFPRADLIDQIEKRTNKMIRVGGIKEVKAFNKLNINKSLTANKIIGINEINEYLLKLTNLTETKEKISIKTRQYAKRQVTWSRNNMVDWNKVSKKDLESFIKNFK